VRTRPAEPGRGFIAGQVGWKRLKALVSEAERAPGLRANTGT